MRKLIKNFLFLLTLVVGLSWSSFVFAEESIKSFWVDIKMNPDSSIEISESIIYDFGDDFRHGIFREIPCKYKARGGNYTLDITDIFVVDEYGSDYQFTTSKSGDLLKIKIGDPDTTITGENRYIINYKVQGAVNYFEEHDELYWNVTGNDWPVNIERATAQVHLPTRLVEEDIRFDCFRGFLGSTNQCRVRAIEDDGSIKFIENGLLSGQGMTVVIGVPKDIIYEPTIQENIWKKFKDNLILFLPILLFVILYSYWYRKGRDPEGKGTIIPHYEGPEGMTPAEVGTIVDETVNKCDISSIFIDLAIKGYIKINRIEEKQIIGKKVDYRIDLLKPEDEKLKDFEKEFLKELIKERRDLSKEPASYIRDAGPIGSIKLSDLKYKFYKTINSIKKLLYRSVVNDKYFTKNPEKVRTTYIVIGIGVTVFGFFVLGLFNPIGFVSTFLCGVLVIVFGFLMPAKTVKGVKAKEHILGLKQYLKVAEEDRIKFHNAPHKNPELFEKLLPYAMVLKVEKEWAQQFKDVYTESPGWYGDSSGRAFNSIIFVNSLHSFATQANSTLAAHPSSASSGGSGFSGGFSGGGFGGGGGGSW